MAQDKELEALEAAKEAEKAATTEVSVEITKEMAEKFEEFEAKLDEKIGSIKKSFAFHGTEQESAKELTKAQKAKQAVEFVKAVQGGDVVTARKYSDERANALGWSEREKALSDAGSAGSEYLVPTVFETEIRATFDNYDEIIRDADVQTVNRPGYVFNLNELDTRVVAWFTDEDGAGLTASQPTFSEPQIAIADLMGSTDLTLDFMEDTEVDIMSNLSRQYGEQFAQKIQARLINGDVTVSGVVTKGIFNAAGTNEILIANTTSGYSGVTADDIENAYFSAISIDHFQQANKDGSWYMSALTLQKLRANIRAASGDNDTISVFDPARMTLSGRPVVLTNQAPTPATTTSNPFIVYGNLANHLKVRRKAGLTMKLNDMGTSRAGRNLNWQPGRELVVRQRIGHQVVLTEGLTVIKT